MNFQGHQIDLWWQSCQSYIKQSENKYAGNVFAHQHLSGYYRRHLSVTSEVTDSFSGVCKYVLLRRSSASTPIATFKDMAKTTMAGNIHSNWP